MSSSGTTRRSITILAPSLTSNSMGRTHVLASMLSRAYDVQVLGFDDGPVWEPLRLVNWTPNGRYRFDSWWSLRRAARQLASQITGDVIYCVKPLLASFGVGLMASTRLHKPVVLDIDDWELGFLVKSPIWEMRHFGSRWLSRTTSPLATRVLDIVTGRAASITVSSSFLQALHGGAWVPHARDISTFPSAPGNSPLARDSAPVVLFAGTPKPHKGLNTLAEAWPQVGRPATLRLIAPPDAEGLSPLRALRRPDIEIVGTMPYADVLQNLARASIVVIPQDNSRDSVGQLPMKLLDAMALGRPIVSTWVGDIPLWLDGGKAGLCVPPGDAPSLARAIRRLLDDRAEAADMGRRARERLLEYGSFDAVEPTLYQAIEDALAGRKVRYPAPFAGAKMRATEAAASR